MGRPRYIFPWICTAYIFAVPLFIYYNGMPGSYFLGAFFVVTYFSNLSCILVTWVDAVDAAAASDYDKRRRDPQD